MNLATTILALTLMWLLIITAIHNRQRIMQLEQDAMQMRNRLADLEKPDAP